MSADCSADRWRFGASKSRLFAPHTNSLRQQTPAGRNTRSGMTSCETPFLDFEFAPTQGHSQLLVNATHYAQQIIVCAAYAMPTILRSSFGNAEGVLNRKTSVRLPDARGVIPTPP